jgi:hypothetical protein
VGDDGVWIVKNSWGGSWGDGGYCYVAYGACNIGAGTTSLRYTPPPVEVGVSSPDPDELYYGDAPVEINWFTDNETVDAVDLYFGTAGSCQDQLIAAGVPNTGSYVWQMPNVTTDRATVLVFPSEGTHRGYGFTESEFSVLGHQTRYVSADGLNIPPYDTPATAAHSVADAVLAGAGRDTVFVAGGDYLGAGITFNSQCHVQGGWSPDFTVHDPETYPTRLRGTSGTVRFNQGARDYCGISHVTFYDCAGATGSEPVNGHHGAAIIVVDASPVIEHCVFENNRAALGTGTGWGGAILVYGGAPVIRDCTFTGNIASHGGAIALSQSVDALIERCDFVANTTSDSTQAFAGGSIYVDGGQVRLDDVSILDSASGNGGGLSINGGAIVVAQRLEIAGNRSVVNGAGIHVQDGTLDIAQGTIADNRSWTGSGAGLFVSDSGLELRNVAIRGNQAPSLGGGLYAQNVTEGTLANLLIHANSGANGGGAFVLASGPVAFRDNVVTSNTGGGVYLGGPELVSACNLAHGNTGGDFLNGPGADDLTLDPRFAAPEVGDFAPGVHSPLIDSGSNLGGPDWDGSHADRGLHGGPAGVPAGPGQVLGLVGQVEGNEVSLSWDASAEAVTYVVYRDSAATFVPAPELVCQTIAAPTTEFNETVPDGDWYYLVGAVDAAGHAGGFSAAFDASGGGAVAVTDGKLPAALVITSVAPNPFNPRATVAFAVPEAGPVRLQVFDLRGRLVRTLEDGQLSAGRHTAIWDGSDRSGRQAATGVYFIRLDDGRRAVTTKAVLAK